MTKKNSRTSITFINSRLTSTISISLVLFLLGLIILLGVFANTFSTYVRENLSFSIILGENVRQSEIVSLQNKLNTAPFVKKTKYISKEQAAKELGDELGENPEVFLGYNPLNPSIEVFLKSEYSNQDSIEVIKKGIRQNVNIKDITYQKDLLQSVNQNVRKAGIILGILAIILLIISFALISNTIRLTIYSKRFLIHTMKLVGATGGFIRRPFIWNNIGAGIIAGIIAISMLSVLVYYLSTEISNFYELISINSILIVYAIVIVLGILISVTATFFAVNRYLRMRVDSLYYI